MAGSGAKLTKISWLVAGGLAAWTAGRAGAADRLRRTEDPAVLLVSFTPLVARVAPWAALGLRLTRRRGPATTAAVAAAGLGLIVGSRAIARPQPEARGPKLRVVSLNLYFGRADAEAAVALVREAGADVLFVQELTADAVTRLKQAGLEELMPHARIDLRDGPRGSGIYARLPLGDGPPVAPIPSAQPTALLQLPDGETVELICVHPAAPTQKEGATRWRDELAVLPPPGARPRVVAGDFNASLDHAAFRAVLGLGYADSARQTGQALIPTWGWPGRRAVITLDHVLASRDCAVRDYSVHPVPGSDHRAVYAAIQLPEPSS